MQVATTYTDMSDVVRRLRAQIDLIVSLVFTVLFFWLWPTNLVSDDAGIILKYLDHFAEGYFYTYNPSDGPVFGISSFLHGITAGLFAYTHLLSPLNSLFASNAIGVLLVSVLTLKILTFSTKSYLLGLPAWLVVMLSAPNFVINMKGGMETPLHLATLLAALYCLLRNWPRGMFLACALAIVAKLDSTPMVAVILIAFMYQQGARLSPAQRWQLTRQAVCYLVVPVLSWLAICQYLFGGILPQSAYAKLYYQQHPGGSWFPFIQPWLSDPRSMLVLGICLATTALYLMMSLIRPRKHAMVALALPGAMVLADLALYYVYNPAEQHPWYYALPEFLMRLQLVIFAFHFCRYLLNHYAKVGFAICLAGFAIFSWQFVTQQVQAATQLLRLIETERMDIGRWVKQHSTPTDTLFAGHGHIARESQLYTIDYSGLNSKIATNYRLNLERMIVDLKPTWIVMHGVLSEQLQLTPGYQLRNSFYNIATVGFPTWRIYQRTDEPSYEVCIAVDPDMVQTDKQISKNANGLLTITGRSISFSDFPTDRQYSALILGFVRPKQDLIVTASLYDRDHSLVASTSTLLTHPTASSAGNTLVQEWIIPWSPDQSATTISIRAHIAKTGASGAMIIFDPVLMYHNGTD